MPATLTYPGIYVEEVPSGVHPIAGVWPSCTVPATPAGSFFCDDPMSLAVLAPMMSMPARRESPPTLGGPVFRFLAHPQDPAVVLQRLGNRRPADLP